MSAAAPSYSSSPASARRFAAQRTALSTLEARLIKVVVFCMPRFVSTALVQPRYGQESEAYLASNPSKTHKKDDPDLPHMGRSERERDRDLSTQVRRRKGISQNVTFQLGQILYFYTKYIITLYVYRYMLSEIKQFSYLPI